MDLGLSLHRIENFRIFQGMIIERYEQLAQTDNFLVMDGTLPVQQLQQHMRQVVSSQIDLKRFKANELGTILAQSKSQIQQDAQEKREVRVADEAASKPVHAPETPECVAGDGFSARAQEINGLIARRAYELFASRGFAHGHEREDWRQAESEIVLDVPVDITETETEVIVRAEVPGFSESNLEVRAALHSLCITGERPQASAPTQGRIVYSERRAAHLFRVLDLPSEIDPERMNITLGNGILQIRLRKARVTEKVHVLAKAAAA
jgi:HSP20 family protein